MAALRRASWAAAAAFLFLAGAPASRAAGFSLMEQGVSGLGTAYAGAAATAEDASTLFYNPAGLVRLKGANAVAGIHLISPTIQLENKGTTTVAGNLAGGNDGGEAGVTKYLPNFYFSYGMDKLAVGLGVYAPFGLATSYDSDWFGRYFATESSLATVNINPAVAYQVDKRLSLGLGLSAQFLDAKLSRKMNVGNGVNPAFDQLYDGNVDLTADGWAYGFTLGALADVTDTARVGLNYRSRYKYKLDGDADYTLPTFTSPPLANAATAAAVNAQLAAKYSDEGAETRITMPDMASLSYYQQVTPAWAVMADATWTNWSVFKNLKIEFDDGRKPDKTSYDWKDAWRFSLGATYRPVDPLLLRAGVAYDQSPVPDALHRTPRVPDSDRYWASLGASYAVLDWLKIDAGYTHIFVEGAKIHNDSTETANNAVGTLDADVKSFVDIASLQLTMHW